MSIFVAYIPVWHQGYENLLIKRPDITEIHILDEEVLSEFPYLAKDIRALAPKRMKHLLESLEPRKFVGLANLQILSFLATSTVQIVLADDEISDWLVANYFSNRAVELETTFLRYDKKRTMISKEVVPDLVVSRDAKDLQILVALHQEAMKSSDWWRQVGAAAVRDGEIILIEHNTSLPTAYSTYISGDPRGNFKGGINPEITCARHAEIGLICQAASKGIALAGASLYVTVFPCSVCAKAVASAGFKECYFEEGYSNLDAMEVLKTGGIKLIKIEQSP